MQIVNIITRIGKLMKARDRANQYAERNPETEIDFRIQEKIISLQTEIKDYFKLEENKEKRIGKRKSIKTACRLLNLDYYKIIH